MPRASVPPGPPAPRNAPPPLLLAARGAVLAVLIAAAMGAGPAFAHEGHELECVQTCGLGNFCEEHPDHEVCNDEPAPKRGDLEGEKGSKVNRGEQSEAKKRYKPQAPAVRAVPVGGVDAGGGRAQPAYRRFLPVLTAVVLVAIVSFGWSLRGLLAGEAVRQSR